MKSILFIRESNQDKIGGIEEIILWTARKLFKEKLFLPILATSDAKSFFSKRFRQLGFRVYEISIRGKGGIRRGVKDIEMILKKENIALIQSEMFRESIIGRKIKYKYHNLRHIFKVHTHIEGSNIPNWKKYIYHTIDNWTSKNVDFFMPISIAVKKELIHKSNIPSEHIRVVYNGVPSLGVTDPPVSNNSLLNKSIVIIGDLQERKQQHIAVEAIGILYSKKIKVELHLIGRNRNNYKNKIQEIAKVKDVNNLIHFYGYKNRENIYDIIKNIPVIILPSLFEGIPTSIIEGMSLRKLVIATPVGGVKELIRDNINGFLHPPQNAGALANILGRIFTEPAKTWEPMRNAGYKTWKEKFSMEQMMEGLIEVYKELNLID